MEEKIYSKGIYFKEVETKFGEILKLSVNVKDFTEFLKANQNEKGYVNIDVLPRKQAGKYGDTHYAVLNTYKKKEVVQEEETDDAPF